MNEVLTNENALNFHSVYVYIFYWVVPCTRVYDETLWLVDYNNIRYQTTAIIFQKNES